MTLFRPESTEARRQPHVGSIVLPAHRTAWWLCVVIAAFITALAVLIAVGESRRRATVPGYVVPQAGVLHVHAPMDDLIAVSTSNWSARSISPCARCASRAS